MAARVHHSREGAEAAAREERRAVRRALPVDERRALAKRSQPKEMRRERERRRQREEKPRCGEVAGGTAAECAAVFCCFPCAVVEIVVLAAVRVPTALCQRAVRQRRRRVRAALETTAKRKELGELLAAGRQTTPKRMELGELLAADVTPRSVGGVAMAKKAELEAVANWPTTTAPDHFGDAEMWARFHGAGFWRSPSQREERR